MQQDFTGHLITPTKAEWRPRMGQWVLFRLKDTNKHIALVEIGAHTARDGSLVGIFQEQYVSSPLKIVKANGTTIEEGGEMVPPKIILVDADGNNLPYVERQKGGHVSVSDVFFYMNSPNVTDIHPLEDKTDLPPGRVINPNWNPK